ncbi:sodium:solute symporter family protein [Desulfurococcaceae archaeon MEX13E-LK6-19]|nr:sodium:solute symporter family protein [Desulfurococcaceae archaeon MEX13E-LK6-19]
MQILIAIVLSLYFLVGTIIAWYSRKVGIKTAIDYYVAGYRLGGFLAAMTYAATTYSAFMMIGLVGFAYATGVGAFGFEILYLIATVFLLTLFSHRVWRLARERKWVSPAEMLGDLYGSRILAMTVSIIYLVALIPYAVAQLVGLGNLMDGVGLGYVTGVVFGALIVFLWTYLAGIWSVASTDTYQGLWMIVASMGFLGWLLLFMVSNNLTLDNAFAMLGREGLLGLEGGFWSFSIFLAFTLPWVFFAVTNPQVVQRLYMPRDEKALRAMIIYFSVFGLLYTVLVTMIGLLARSLSIAGVIPAIDNRDLVTPTLLLYTNPLLAAIVFTSIVAAAVSTLDSIILTLASSASRDIYRYKEYKKTMTYTIIVLLVLVTMTIALLKPGFVVELSVLSSLMLLPLAPVTLIAWINPWLPKRLGLDRVALPAILSGFIIGFIAAIVYGPKKAFVTSILGLPISVWVLIVSTLILFTPIIKSIWYTHVAGKA